MKGIGIKSVTFPEGVGEGSGEDEVQQNDLSEETSHDTSAEDVAQLQMRLSESVSSPRDSLRSMSQGGRMMSPETRAQLIREEAFTEQLLKIQQEVNNCAINYASFVDRDVSFGGKYLTGSHTHVHKDDALRIAADVGAIVTRSDESAEERIAQVRSLIAGFSHRAATGPFSFFASKTLAHDFKTHFLDIDTPSLQNAPA